MLKKSMSMSIQMFYEGEYKGKVLQIDSSTKRRRNRKALHH
jgi:hypothetical protein